MHKNAWLNTGSGWQETPAYAPPYPIWCREGSACNDNEGTQFIDINGDGLVDLVHNLWTGGRMHKNAWLNSSDRRYINSITSALNILTTITYTPLTNKTLYTKGTSAQYPEVDVQAPIYVVSKVTVDDGIGGVRDTHYQYAGLKSSYLRGSLGFASMTSIDDTLGLHTHTEYQQNYPYTGQVSRSQQLFDNGTPDDTTDDILLSDMQASFNSITTHPGIETLNNLGPIFSYSDLITKYNYTLQGDLVTQVETQQSYDNFGNPTEIAVNTTGKDYDGNVETYTTQTVNTYTNDDSNWFLGRLIRADVTQTLPSGDSASRASSFEYDAGTGLLIRETVEPDHPELQLITDYGYDAYGNKTTVTVSGGQ